MADIEGYTYDGVNSSIKHDESALLYGSIETVKIFEEIFPTWTGEASIVGAPDIYTFFDTSIDFDINEYLMSGMEAKISFKTGKLSGYSFPLKRFDSGLGKITILPITDERDLSIPNVNTAFQIATGDKFTILDIRLPQEYIDEAEMRLFAAAKEWIDNHCLPTVIYDAEIDSMYLKNHPITRTDWFEVGDTLNLVDAALIDGTQQVRIIGFKRDLLKPEKYSFTFGNSAYRNTINSLNKKTKGVESVIRNSVYNDTSRRQSANIRIKSNIYDGGEY